MIRKGLSPIVSDNFTEYGLFLAGNPLQKPPLIVVEEGLNAINRYFLDLRNSGEYINNEVKIIVVGNCTVGKSTLAEYLVTDEINEMIRSTEGFDSYQWNPSFNVNTENGLIEDIKVRLFDFGGQEYYHDSHHLFFTDNTIYLLLWEKDSEFHHVRTTGVKYEESKEIINVAMEHHPVEYWLDAIKRYQYKPDDIKFDSSSLINQEILNTYNVDQRSDELADRNDLQLADYEYYGETDSDLYNNNDRINQSEYFPSFDADEIQLKPRLIKTPVVLIQNKIDKDGILFKNADSLVRNYPDIYDSVSISLTKERRADYLKNVLIKEVIEEMKFVGAILPSYYNDIKEWISYESQDNFSISKKEFYNICKEIALDGSMIKLGPKRFEDIMGYLRSLGMILHFKENKKLKPIIFLSPKKILVEIYKVLNKDLEKSNGKFNYKKIKSLVKGNPKEIREIMIHFNMIFEVPHEKQTYIAPQYLNDRADNRIKMFLNNFSKTLVRFVFKGYIHKSIILHFFSEYGDNVMSDGTKDNLDYYLWKNGIVLEKEFNHKKYQVLVSFTAPIHIEDLKEPLSSKNQIQKVDISVTNNEGCNDFVKEIEGYLDELLKKWDTEKHYSYNGVLFATENKLDSAQKNKHALIAIKDKQVRLGLFRDFLKSSDYPMKKVFICYSARDRKYLGVLETHLAPLKTKGIIDTWNDLKLEPGDKWNAKIMDELHAADVILVLVSPNLLETKYVIEKELPAITKINDDKKATVIPIALDYCQFSEVLSGTQYFSNKVEETNRAKDETDILIINKYENHNKAWYLVFNKIKSIISSGNTRDVVNNINESS